MMINAWFSLNLEKIKDIISDHFGFDVSDFTATIKNSDGKNTLSIIHSTFAMRFTEDQIKEIIIDFFNNSNLATRICNARISTLEGSDMITVYCEASKECLKDIAEFIGL